MPKSSANPYNMHDKLVNQSIHGIDLRQLNQRITDKESRERIANAWIWLGEQFRERQANLPDDQAMARRELSFHDDVLLLGHLCALLNDVAGDIVEIGVWKGKSLALMNTVCHGKRRVIGIDPFALPNQYQEFLHYKASIFPNVQIIRGFSELAAANFYTLTPQVALLHIDGGHAGRNVLLDFLLYHPSVVPGGFILFDDYADFEYSPEVGPAVDLLRSHGYFTDFHVLGRVDGFHNSYLLQRK